MARYIINETKEHFQCIVISLKEEFYTRAEALIGITAEVIKVNFVGCSYIVCTRVPCLGVKKK